jgi:PAS domain S-box-containing protein
LEFERLDDLDSLLTLALPVIFLILLIFSQRTLISYKRECLRRKQVEQRLRDLIYDLRMRVKYQSEEINEILDAQLKAQQKADFMCNVAQEPICVFDINWIFLQTNPALSRLLGYTKNEILSGNFFDFVQPEERDATAAKMQRISKENPKCTLQNRIVCKDGSSRCLSWHISYIHDQNIYIAGAIDMTARMKIEEMTLMLNEALRHERIKTEFYSNLSHELKTPLNVLISTQQLLKLVLSGEQIGDNKNINRYLHVLKQNCFRLLRLVNNMIDVTRIESGFLSLKPGNHNIISIVEDVCLSVADYIKTRNIELIFDTSVEELTIACDPDKIERIILNILSNAVKFTDEGGSIYVDINCDHENVTISIKDTGIGIPEDKLETIFERFKQLDKTLPRNYGGSGIGLSLVKSLVNMHRGKIYAKSSEGKGAEFVIILPIHTIEKEHNIPHKENGFARQSRVERITIEFSDIYVS